MSTPVNERLDRLPQWAQAYIGRLSNQIMILKDQAGSFNTEPTPIYSFLDSGENERVRTYLSLGPTKTFHIEYRDVKLMGRLLDNGGVGLVFMSGDGIIVPQKNGLYLQTRPVV